MKRKILKMLIRAFLLPVALLLAGTSLARAADVQFLTLMVNGEPVIISLAEKPVITFTDNTLHIVTEATEVDIPVADITGGTFVEDDPSTIKDPDLVKAMMSAGRVCFSGLEPFSTVNVYNVNGQLLKKQTAGNDGTVVIDLSNQPKGCYVVRSATQTIKFTNK